jgi:hypothetical protein
MTVFFPLTFFTQQKINFINIIASFPLKMNSLHIQMNQVKTVMINNHYCTYGGVLQVSLTLTTNPRNKHIPVVAEPPALELNYQIVGMRDIWVEYQIVDYNKKIENKEKYLWAIISSSSGHILMRA